MKLSLGPNQFYWRRTDTNLFYERMLEMSLDIIYVGEVVCGKRNELRAADWLELAFALADASDKEIVVSTLTLLESGADFNWVRRVCDNNRLLVEANDMSAVQLLSQAGLPFACGPAVNVYNHRTLATLVGKGLVRWTVPVEIGGRQLGQILARCDKRPEVELLAYGHMPLAYSARCFTARHLGIGKDQCERRCIEFAEGIALKSQEQQQLFLVNGIQTMSGEPVNLLPHVEQMRASGVDILRLSPQLREMEKVIEAFGRARLGTADTDLLPGGVDGYWHDQCGFEIIARDSA